MITEKDFEQATSSNSWKRVNDVHPLDLYIGKDERGRYALEFIGNFIVNRGLKSSALIEINHYKDFDKKKSLVLSLNDNLYLSQFCIFCDDIVNSTAHLNKFTKKGYELICNLFFKWQKLFKSQNSFLSENEIKGLIGELMFLRNELYPRIGISNAISSWSGPDATKKDFSLDKEWYEIKTIDFGKHKVLISSIEQLDSDIDGVLCVYQLEKMASEFSGITLNKLVSSIFSLIGLMTDKEILDEKLKKVGYVSNPYYDLYVYEYKSLIQYDVNRDFPRLVRKEMNDAIINASYELSLTNISKFIK